MIEQDFHPDLVRFAFVLGIIVSIWLYDRSQITTGGIAVPGYLGFIVFLPFLLPAVLMVAFSSWFIVHKLIPKVVVISRRSKFALTIVISAGIHLIVDLSFQIAGLEGPASPLLRGIGYVVPGLIAHDFSRHGIPKTLASVGTASVTVGAALLIVALALPELARLYPSPDVGMYPIDLVALPMLVFLSLVAWIGVARYRQLRCGGFLGGAYIALLVLQPMQLMIFIILALVTVGIVRQFMLSNLIIFGRRRFAAHLLIGACLSWTVFKIQEAWLGYYTVSVLTPSLGVLGVLVTGLVASDVDRVGVLRTTAGTLLTVLSSLSGTLLALELITEQRPVIALPLVAAFTVLMILIFTRLPERLMHLHTARAT